MIKKLTLMLSLVLSCILVSAQSDGANSLKAEQARDRCGTMDFVEKRIETDSKYAEYLQKLKKDALSKVNLKSAASIPCGPANSVVIPVAIHFDNSYSCDDAQCLIDGVNAQMDVLNEDFAATNADLSAYQNLIVNTCGGPDVASTGSCISFCVATQNHPTISGIPNGQPAVTIGDYNGSGITTNGEWPGYLNIFVVDGLGFGEASGIPGDLSGEGVQVDGAFFGGPGFGPCASGGNLNDDAAWILGRTMTHEVGHYLGLYHVWGDVNGSGCGGDDNITDTPDQAGPSNGCPTTCAGLATGCGGTSQYNYMDYFDDPCLVMFTEEQASVMNTFAVNANWATGKCTAPGAISSVPPCSVLPGFSPDDGSATSICLDDTNTLQIVDESSNGPVSWSYDIVATSGDLVFSPSGAAASTSASPVLTFTGGTSGVIQITQTVCDAGGFCEMLTQSTTVNLLTGAACPTFCDFTLTMNDTYGDGWNGGSIEVFENGVSIGTYSHTNFGQTNTFTTEDVTVAINDGSAVTVVWTSGTFDQEASYSFTDPFGIVVLSDGTNPTGGAFTASCVQPTCDDGIQNQDETGIDCGGALCQPCPVCGSTFTDSGGVAGDYSDDENITYVVCPDDPACEAVSITFTAFSMENNGGGCYDFLTVFDGSGTGGAAFNTPGGATEWCWDLDDATPAGSGDLVAFGAITSTSVDGCITVVMSSDGSITREGWEFDVTCVNTCVDCVDPPTASIDATDEICEGASLDLSGTNALIGGAAVSGTWSTAGDGTFDNTVLGTGSIYTPGTADIAAGSTTITITADDPDGDAACEAATADLVLTINPLPVAVIVGDTEFCQGESLNLTASGGSTYSWSTGETTASIVVNTAETFTVDVIDANGCIDSESIILTELLPTAGSTDVSFCEGASVDVNGTIYTAAGAFTQTLTNAAGCDSTLTVNVTEVAVLTSTVDLSACTGATADYNGNALAAGSSTDFTLTSSAGCDSIVTVVVAELLPTAGSTDVSICAGGSIDVNGTSYTAAGAFTQTLTNAAGCDSTLTVNVTEVAVLTSTVDLSACTGATADYNGNALAAGSSTNFTLTSTAGCDSIVTVNVAELLPTVGAVDVMLCTGETVDVNGTIYTSGGAFSQTLVNAAGCDSTLTVNVSEMNCTSMASIADPCACIGDDNGTSGDGIGTFTEIVEIDNLNGISSGDWSVVAIVANAAGTAATIPTGIAVNDLLTDNGDGTYSITFTHADGAGYTLTVENNISGEQKMIGNQCVYAALDLLVDDATVCNDGSDGTSTITATETTSFGGTIVLSGSGVTDAGLGTGSLDGTGLAVGNIFVTATLTPSPDGNNGFSPDNGTTPVLGVGACDVEKTASVVVEECICEGSISGIATGDNDCDGIYGDPLVGIGVELLDGICTSGLDCPTTTTDGTGTYTFTNVPCGMYDILLDEATLPCPQPSIGSNPRMGVPVENNGDAVVENFGFGVCIDPVFAECVSIARVCSGNSIYATLDQVNDTPMPLAPASDWIFEWYLDGILVSTITGIPYYSPNGIGNYTVVITDPSNCLYWENVAPCETPFMVDEIIDCTDCGK